MTEWTTNKVRSTFLEFFKNKAHTVVPSAPVVPLQDPTLLFVNAGMAQFKPKFLGMADAATDFGQMTRAVDSQICIRAGGKHNDLDDVGHDTYHHTLFEMLGSWSFGDYFKKDAINWAWELLTEVYKVPKDRLYVTYFEGSEKLGLAADDEARDLWRALVPEERILKGNAKDNFWEMGDVGPCGPCSEIHYDHIGGRDASSLVNKDDPTVVEVWNLVFMQYNRAAKGAGLTPLPAQHVDTGMGLERLAAALQGKKSNYDIDLWKPLFAKLQEVTKFPQSYEELAASEAAQKDPNSKEALAVVAYRVCADHARTLTVALADGAAPDRQGRGFVLRRIIRRAVRYGVQFLNAEFGFFEQLVQSVVDILGGHFTYLTDARAVRRVQTLIRDEEASFARTWKTGLKHFETAVAASKSAKSKEINPEDSFVLHDRYGFPIDLTKLLAEREGLVADVDKFQEVMKKNQIGGGRMEAAKHFFDAYQTDELLKNRKLPTTDDSPKYVWEKLDRSVKVQAIFNKTKKEFVEEISVDTDFDAETVGIVLDRTNFYCEGGGQIFDQGTILSHGVMDASAAAAAASNDEPASPSTIQGGFDVKRAFSFAGYAVHIGDLTRGKIRVGDTVSCDVDYERRQLVAMNHTGTHLLNFCLREVLQYGHPDQFTEVNQRGSLVTDDYMRFDFSWNSKLAPADLAAVEKRFNAVIDAKVPVYRKSVPLEKAKAINGIRMEFDVKYGAEVIVVSLGKDIDTMVENPSGDLGKQYSVELCGGTHVKNTEEIRACVIISEDSLTKGVRRMTLFTGDAAQAAMSLSKELRADFDAIRKTQTDDYDGKAKQFSVLNKKVGDSQIPLVDKIQLRDEIDKATKDTLNDKKNAVVKLKAAAVDLGKALGEKHKSSGDKFAVMRVPDPKLVDKDMVQTVIDNFVAVAAGGAAATNGDGAAAAAAASAGNPVSVLFIGADAQKAIAVSAVNAAHTTQINAVEWVKSACGGKGGGKPNAAQGGLAAAEVDKAVASAIAFAKSKGL